MFCRLSKDKLDCPFVPRQAGPYRHTCRVGPHFVYNAAASRPVNKTEIRLAGLKGEPQKAMDAEWQKLLEQEC